jgi:hypothetical protein
MPPPNPIQILEAAVASYEPYLHASGELFDPLLGEPTQYGTPYHALCQAVLAARGDPSRRAERLERAARGQEAALDHVDGLRLLANASSVGAACGCSELRVVAQEDLRPVASLARGPTKASLHLRARMRGAPYFYEMSLQVEESGVQVEESTPGWMDYTTLLLPYLRDGGWPETTAVRIERGEDATVRFRLGQEVVCVEVDGPIEHILDLPYGYENRRGLYGLLRIGLAGRRDGVRYRIAVEV